MSTRKADIAELDRFYPPCGPCAFCGHRDKRHRLWDAWMLPIEAGNETAEEMAHNFGFGGPLPKICRTRKQKVAYRRFYGREHLEAVLRIRPYRLDGKRRRKTKQI